ncbi:MAG: hypothetical protein COU67_02645 [Candidatus Pacebacteria bacterium CG10_big_fil_rev_8_21_14_0_10_44_54]|nr:MAG: hypothetical protein COU67_02645 [Candidatus Pacebacteria bacterium CG10_big_fil_rev_8_21_14_0_10_44_54]
MKWLFPFWKQPPAMVKSIKSVSSILEHAASDGKQWLTGEYPSLILIGVVKELGGGGKRKKSN